MKQRDFAAATAGLAAMVTAGAAGAERRLLGEDDRPSGERGVKFNLKYAPHPGHFRRLAGNDYLDQLRFAAEVGFTAWEDQGMMGRPVDLQEKAAAIMQERGLTVGTFVGYASFNQATFADPDEQSWQRLRARLRQVIDCAKRVNGKWTTIVPGIFAPQVKREDQLAKVVETLKRCAEILEPERIVMVLQPATPGPNDPECIFSTLSEAYQICKAVDSPSCKIRAALSDQLGTEGALIRDLDRAWDEIASLQVGEHPGLPSDSGKINCSKIFWHLHQKGFQGVVGMEHGVARKGTEGELGVIQAYRDADNF